MPAARHLFPGHIALTPGMKWILLADIVGFVDDVIPAGDVDVGDVIVLPDADDPVLVSRVRLGREGSSSRSHQPAAPWPVKKSGR